MPNRLDFMVRNKEDLVNAVKEIGFLPFFANSLTGFSLEEHTAPEIWFTFEKYRIIQDKLYQSDFDKLLLAVGEDDKIT